MHLLDTILNTAKASNSPVHIDEILPLGLDILVLRYGVENGQRSRDFRDHEHPNQFIRDERTSWTEMDTSLFQRRALGKGVDESEIVVRHKRISQEFDARSRRMLKDLLSSDSLYDYNDYENIQDPAKDPLAREFQEAGYDYRFRPTELTKRLKEADLVIAHPSVAEKIRREVPQAKVALLYTGQGIEGNLKHVPQVCIDKPDRGFFSRQGFGADTETVRLLFKGEEDRRYELTWFGRERDSINWDPRILHNSFYAPLEHSRDDRHNPQKRTSRTINLYEKRQRRMRAQGTGENLMHALRHFRGEPDETTFVPNFYNLGNPFRIGNGTDIILLQREAKEYEVRKFYEQLWLKPLSEAEAEDRRMTHKALVEDKQYLSTVRSLETAVNKLIEPYMHLSSMAKLISANLLGSRWGATLERQPFYDDFMGTAGEFVTKYEEIVKIVNYLLKKDPPSREMRALLIPLRETVLGISEFHWACRYIKDVVNEKPADFSGLERMFMKTLYVSGASLIKKLEKYDPTEDSGARPLYFGKRRGFEDDEAEEGQGKEGEKQKRQGSMRGQKSPALQKLLDKFHAQNPISAADGYLPFLDSVGTRLAAFTAYAEFIRSQPRPWCLPESAPKDEGVLEIVGGWYPMTRLQRESGNVPNDISFNLENRVMVIDGSNACGKTNYLFETAFIANQVRTGGYVPAQKARASHFDDVICRLKPTGMGRSGALKEELHSIQTLVDQLGGNVFLGIDETYLSTNHDEGEALTYGTLRRFAEAKPTRAIITSHYPSLHDIINDPRMEGVFFRHVEFEDTPQGIRFTYKVKDGPNRRLDYAPVIAVEEKIHPAIIGHAFRFLEKNGGIEGVNVDRINQHIAEGEVPQAAGIEGVVDGHTKSLLVKSMWREDGLGSLRRWFSTEANFNFSYSKELDTKIEEMMQTPLLDYHKVRDRLGTIEVFIKEKNVRKRADRISAAFSPDYETRLIHNLGAIAGSFSMEEKHKNIDGYRKMIGEMMKNYRALSLYLKKRHFATETFSGITQQYEALMAEGGPVRVFFEYLAGIENQFRAIEGRLHVRRGESSKMSPHDRKELEGNPKHREDVGARIGITQADLEGIISVEKIKGFGEAFSMMKSFFSELYTYKSLADQAVENGWVKPTILPREGNTFVIIEGKYELYHNDSIVPNNTRLYPRKRVEVLEGSNDGGKTCDLKKIGRIAVRAQSGGYVPAKNIIYSMRDRIIMREKGEGNVLSAFQTDCRYANEVVPPAGEYWLVLMDETFTSTEWKGGRALTYGIMKSVQDQGSSLMVISSHYRGLREATYGRPIVQFSHFPIDAMFKDDEWKIEFPHRKRPGPLRDPRYALKVARENAPGGYEKRFFDQTILDYAEQRLQQRKLQS